jgi:hypothetical protein
MKIEDSLQYIKVNARLDKNKLNALEQLIIERIHGHIYLLGLPRTLEEFHFHFILAHHVE